MGLGRTVVSRATPKWPGRTPRRAGACSALPRYRTAQLPEGAARSITLRLSARTHICVRAALRDISAPERAKSAAKAAFSARSSQTKLPRAPASASRELCVALCLAPSFLVPKVSMLLHADLRVRFQLERPRSLLTVGPLWGQARYSSPLLARSGATNTAASATRLSAPMMPAISGWFV